MIAGISPQKKKLIERWVFGFAKNQGTLEGSSIRKDGALMRKLWVAIRSLFCFVRTRQAFPLFYKRSHSLSVDLYAQSSSATEKMGIMVPDTEFISLPSSDGALVLTMKQVVLDLESWTNKDGCWTNSNRANKESWTGANSSALNKLEKQRAIRKTIIINIERA